MIKDRIQKLRKLFKEFNIDGYIIPKNDEFFSEFSREDHLKIISNFSGSAGYAVVLKNKNYLFVDGRYTIQAQIESGNNFIIKKYNDIIDCGFFKKLVIGYNPKLFTSNQIKMFFSKKNKVKIISNDLIGKFYKKKDKNLKPFFSLKKDIVGQGFKSKIDKVSNYLKAKNFDFLFISAPENVAWLLNIRGNDNPNSPLPNCHLFLDNKKNFYLFADRKKTQALIKEKKINQNQIFDFENFNLFVNTFKEGKVLIDKKTCSVFNENILRQKLKIIKGDDPIYMLKAIKNSTELSNMINTHIIDGIALTKFLYWIKNVNKKEISEFEAQNKLEKFRKKNKNYLYPSFDTIAGTGSNGAIIHYRATKKNTKKIKKEDIFLCDSGGQYKFGTTDVTRTICFSKPKKLIKEIFTRVLRGHIAVANINLNKFNTGRLIDKKARKFLKSIKLDYEHGTGHGVGFFSNVHEGPQSLSKLNNIKIREGMILSNEPGYYKKGFFGIRIENLIYAKKINKKLVFKNLTLAPIDKDLIDEKQLNVDEKKYMLRYNLMIYSKLGKFLTRDEKKWLLTLF